MIFLKRHYTNKLHDVSCERVDGVVYIELYKNILVRIKAK